MHHRHRKTLEAIFDNPVPALLEWRKIEALLLALGARAVFVLNGKRADFHRPHPGKEAKRYQVRAARESLVAAGVQP